MADPAPQSPMKLVALQLLLWLGALCLGCEAVPLNPTSALLLPRSFLLKSLEQVRKIQAEGTELLEMLCTTYTLCHANELELLGHSLAIPRAPLGSCSSQALRLESCLSQLHSGLVLYGSVLQALGGISSEFSPALDTLQLDVANFATTVRQQMEDLGVAPEAKPTAGAMWAFTSTFQRRAVGVLVTSNLQSSLKLAYEVLRYLAEP
ncbi:granulocyte colony-stimulating factor isoform X2 [Perognathus longimembris pacificus]|uniref:granulocyte colony-stimulating factor isoform X2 n=1 Tax=Perognathus longimembris pacificus TaxID=214514 RepID=UPI0020189296|nr:granulocyte colony-stimulating factor isoform X2 [Perognathus longimembris pacificus]